MFWRVTEADETIGEAGLTNSRHNPVFKRVNETIETISEAGFTDSRQKLVFKRVNEAIETVREAGLTISRQKPVFKRVNEAYETISVVKEIDSFVCLTKGRKRAFYGWNNEDRLIDSEVFFTKSTVRG